MLPTTVRDEAPLDGGLYSRQNGAWSASAIQADAPADGEFYYRSNNNWVVSAVGPRAEPILITLGETVFTALNTWYDVLPAYTFALPRTGNSLIQVQTQIHFIWPGSANNTGTYLDWTLDGGTHYQRTMQYTLSRTDDASVNDMLGTMFIKVSGNSPSINLKARQYQGASGITIVGTQTTAWPALQSYLLLIDGGSTA